MRYYIDSITDYTLKDLELEIAALQGHRGSLISIVDESDGIIAYALGEENATAIAAALNQAST